MIPGIEEKRLVNGVIQNGWPSYATLHQASVSIQDMGDRVITTQVRIDGDVVPDFSGWELYFKGERFVLPSDNPQASKDNSTRNSIVDLQFQSWVIQELKRYYFFEAASVSAGVAIADKYVTPVRLDVEDFVAMLNQVLKYYFGDKVVADLYMSGQGQYSQEPKVIDINYSYLWDVVGQVYEIYGVRNRIVYNSTTGVYTIKFGWPTTDIDITDHDFEYGYQGGLLKFERQVQDETITNILLGRGGEKNLPYRYFKKVDPENPNWAADPDAIPELASIYFDRLRDINFRWYVRGWMHNPNRDTSGDEEWDPGHVFPTYSIDSSSPYYWAYQKGLTDTQFNPVEFVKDDASIEAYGERWGAADDNDEIYPTIQGRSRSPIGRIDEVVAVSEIVTDDINATAAESALEKSINPLLVNYPRSNDTLPIESATFEVPTGQTGNISYAWVGPTDGAGIHINTAQSTLVAVDTLGTEHSISGLSAGTYFLRLRLTLYVPSGQQAYGTFGMENIKLTTSAQDANAWKPTFDIWVKNIWGTTKGSSESADQYATRVWQDILGDRAGNEAKVVFSTGFMSVSEDYEFVIASYPVYDTSKTINGVPSEWRITLRKSDAEYDATGLFIPNASTGGKPIAGDKFFFTGIDMPFLYVTLGEEDLNTNKSSQLEGLSVVNPTWVISLDKVRVHTLEDGEYGQTLADRLAAGAKLRITDPRFSGGDILTLYAQSITYTWNEPSENSPYIVPDIEVVLSDKVVSRQSRADKMESSIQEIRSNYARLDDVERVVRSVAEPMFLKKTGEADSSDSPTQFASKVSSKGFRQGGVGGNGWGFYRDNTKEVAEGEEGEGDSVLEVDRVVVRKELQVNSLVVNQTEYRGGREIQSAAQIECTKVVVDDSGKYVCYFDQKQGSVKNLFVVGDFAYSTEFAPDNTVVKYYRRRVDAVDVDRIVLSDTVKDGAGVPAAGDVIIQYGHESNTARQYVIVRDVIGGGYERMISGLSTVSSNGSEYYFAGRQSGQYSNLPRWFVGAAAGEYAEYLNGQLNIKGRLQVLGESGNYSDLGYLADALPKKGATLIQGGLVLTSMIQLGQVENSAFKVYSGINGKVDETLTDPTKSIAAWYGGEMLEKATWDAMSSADKLLHQYAKTIFRMDGSGYLAGGNIHWDENGYGGIPGITWSRPAGSQNDVITIGSNVILEASQGADQSVAALVSSVNSLQQILDWFEEVNLGDAQNPQWAVRLKKKTIGSSQLDRAFMTYGDQIVGGGTPGGGGGGGATYLYELNDVDSNLQSPNTTGTLLFWDGTKWAGSYINSLSDGQMLAWDATSSKWKNVAAPTGTITSVALESGTNNGTLKLTVNGTPTDNIAVTGWSSKADASALNDYVLKTGDTMTGTLKAPVFEANSLTAYPKYLVTSSAGWYRVATGVDMGVNGFSVILQISRGYYNTPTEAYNVSISVRYNGGVSFTQLSGSCYSSDRLITKVRIDYTNDGACYIDIYYTGGQNNDLRVAGIGNCTVQTPTLVSSPTGSTVEFSLGNGVVSSDKVSVAGGTSGQFMKADGSLDSNTYLTTSTAASTYLPLTGGTITSTSNITLTLNSTHWSSQNVIALQAGGNAVSYIGYSPTYGVYIQNYAATGTPFINITSDGSLKRNNSDVFYHSGNSNKSDVAWACSTLTANTILVNSTSEVDAIYAQYSGTTWGAINFFNQNYYGYSTEKVININAHNGNAVTIGPWDAPWVYVTQSNGKVGIGTTSPQYKLDVNGHAKASGLTIPTGSNTATVSSPGWYRVMEIEEGSYYGSSTILQVSRTYWHEAPQTALFAITISMGTASITKLSSCRNGADVFPKIRVLLPDNSPYNIYYVDVYFSGTTESMLVWNVGCGKTVTPTAETSSGTTIAEADYSGRYGMATTDNLQVGGNIVSGGDQVISSDLTKKTNLVPINLSVEQIANAPAVTFDWKDGHGHSFGSIAQYWKPLLGEMVLGEEGNYTLAYAQGAFTNGIINARAIVKMEDTLLVITKHETEQDKEIARLKERVRDLEKQLQMRN